MINGERITFPITIKVIGNKTYLQSALTIKNGYIDLYQESFNITMETSDNITINKYTGNMTLDYVKEEKGKE